MRKQVGEVGLLHDDLRKIVLYTENGIVYRGINEKCKRVLMYQVDDVMIKSEQKKCDKGLGLPDDKTFYLIELKGCDLKQAATQILDTIYCLGPKLNGFIVNGRIVCSRIPRPDIKSTHVVRLERELSRRKGTLIKQSRILEEVI